SSKEHTTVTKTDTAKKRKLIKKKGKDGKVSVVGVVNEDGTKEMFTSKRLSTIQESPVSTSFPRDESPEDSREATKKVEEKPTRIETERKVSGKTSSTRSTPMKTKVGTTKQSVKSLSRCAVNNLSCVRDVLEEACGDDG